MCVIIFKYKNQFYPFKNFKGVSYKYKESQPTVTSCWNPAGGATVAGGCTGAGCAVKYKNIQFLITYRLFDQNTV